MQDKNLRIYANEHYFRQRLNDGFDSVSFAKSSERVPLVAGSEQQKFIPGMYVFCHHAGRIDTYGWSKSTRVKDPSRISRIRFDPHRIVCTTAEQFEHLKREFKLVVDMSENALKTRHSLQSVDMTSIFRACSRNTCFSTCFLTQKNLWLT